MHASKALSPSPTSIQEREQASAGNQRAVPFVWGAGIECSFIPHLKVDQFEWTQHDRFWRDDFRRAKEVLGLTALRYALPWHEIEKERGKFDWAMADERINTASELGIDLYLDVMHFGTPLWLKQAAGDPEFPESLERFSTVLVERFKSQVHTWCPCNEPLVLSLFSGDYGFWPPHGRRWKGYMPVLSRVVQAVSRSIRAIRRADPQASVLLCDNVENYKSRDESLAVEVHRRNLRRFLALDLLTGRLDHRHPLFSWVTAYGLTELDLQWFQQNPARPDVLGLDYYPNSEWQLERTQDGIRQRRTESPIGLYGLAQAYYNRYGLPMMLTETSADGHAINREIWFEQTVDDCRRLRAAGVPMLGYFWWPLLDQLDWDGALTHRVGKIHEVGVFNLRRLPDGTLSRHPTALTQQMAARVAEGDSFVGTLESLAIPFEDGSDQGPPIGVEMPTTATMLVPVGGATTPAPVSTTSKSASQSTARSASKTNGHSGTAESAKSGNGMRVDPVAGLAGALAAVGNPGTSTVSSKETEYPAILVFSHLRWGFVWQRPQQFLSRFARKHRILFIEEPFFDLRDGAAVRLDLHKVMPNVTVAAPHMPPSWHHNPELPAELRRLTYEAMDALNDDGEFDRPILWYYSPMDSAWSLGHFNNQGVVYDCMDELSQFTGAPRALVENEARLMRHADVVFAGGYELGEKKRKQHHNVHTFGCGVDYAHFSRAADPDTSVPPDIDFMPRPIIGWFGVVDERVDYAMVGEMAKMRPNWSFAMVGPVVKIDPNTLPHAPNLFWLGGRDYQQLPNYCRAFDVNLMCFAINAATQYINPTKGLEYMATGKAIVSTPVRDVVRQWSDIVRIGNNAGEFVAAIEDALASGPNDARVKRGVELAQQCSWERTVSAMQSLIREAVALETRPSSMPIEPLNETQLAEAYAATQGS